MNTSQTGAGRSLNRRLSRLLVALLAAAATVLAVAIGPAPGAHAATTPVTVNVELQGSDNNGRVGEILTGGAASYYANGQWHPITTTNPNNPSIAQTQLDPGSYTFAETYNGTRDTKLVTVGPDATTVYFHAALVFVELQGSDNNGHVGQILDIPGSGSASYYAGAWNPVTTPDPNNPMIVQTEMLPGTYSFAATYNGTHQQKSYTVLEPNPNNGANADQIVYFHAALVFVELQGSDNNGHVGQILDIPGSGSASYYAGGWKSVTTPDPNNPMIVQTEMLPGTYSFAATYNGTRQQKSYTVLEPNPNNGANADQIVYFHAALVSVQLQSLTSSGGVSGTVSGPASYYAGSWKSITTKDPNNSSIVQTEMLPGTYSFAATYNGTRQQKSYTVLEPNPNNGANADQIVSFGFTVADAPPPVYNVTLEAVANVPDGSGTTTHPNVLIAPSFTDPSGYTLTVTVSSKPGNGTVTKNSDGTFTYTPTAEAQNAVAYYDFAKAVAAVGGYAPMPDPVPPTSDSFTLTADNGHGGTISHVVTVPISPYYDIQATSNSATLRYLDDGSGLVGETVIVQSVPLFATSSVLNLDTSFQFSTDPSDYLDAVPVTIGSCTTDPDNANCATPPPPSNPTSSQEIPPLPIHDFYGTSSAQSFMQNTIAAATAAVGVSGTIAASVIADFLTVAEAVVLLW